MGLGCGGGCGGGDCDDGCGVVVVEVVVALMGYCLEGTPLCGTSGW